MCVCQSVCGPTRIRASLLGSRVGRVCVMTSCSCNMCVCVCVCTYTERERERERECVCV